MNSTAENLELLLLFRDLKITSVKQKEDSIIELSLTKNNKNFKIIIQHGSLYLVDELNKVLKSLTTQLQPTITTTNIDYGDTSVWWGSVSDGATTDNGCILTSNIY